MDINNQISPGKSNKRETNFVNKTIKQINEVANPIVNSADERKIHTIWKIISFLGVKEDQPVYVKKMIILFNQIVRILLLLLVCASLGLYFIWNIKIIPMVMIAFISIISLSLGLTFFGKIRSALFLISGLLPIGILLASISAKLHGETNSIFLYMTPRMMIAVIVIMTAAFIGLTGTKKNIYALTSGVLCYAFYDLIHRWFGINPDNLPDIRSHYYIFLIAYTGTSIFIMILIFFLHNINNTYEKMVLKQKEEITNQRDEIEAQRDEIESQRNYVIAQRDELAHQKKQITDSIEYAKRIQQAMLPNVKDFKSYFDESFIFYQPRDIVSGDFYWFTKLDESNKIIVAAADCTGHGVPGAFMSMMGISFLNEITERRSHIEPNIILNELRQHIINSLHQEGKATEQKDGMDIAICVIDKEKMTLDYSGANNPLILIRNRELIELKADHKPVGIFIKDLGPFTKQQIEIQKDDCIYIFSDGYQDQIGGSQGRKFLVKNLKQLFIDISPLPFEQQLKKINETFHTHKGAYSQVDDILVMGFKI